MKSYKIKCDNCDCEEMLLYEDFKPLPLPEPEYVGLKEWVSWEEPADFEREFVAVRKAYCPKCGRVHDQGVKYKKVGEK